MAKDIKALRKRIKSFDSTLHLTGAMGLVASSKMRKATDAMIEGRKYLKAVTTIKDDLLKCPEVRRSVFIKNGEEESSGVTKIIVIAGDRGLCGGYNANVFRLVKSMGEFDIIPIGKRAFDRYTVDELDDFDPDSDRVFDSSEYYTYDQARALADSLIAEYKEGKVSKVGIVYNRYVSIMTQEPDVKWILPLESADDNETKAAGSGLFEPDPYTLLEDILPLYFAGVLYALVKESFACEVAARRMAMDSATKNAKEMIGDLTLEYNRVRQGKITQEITEIVAGAGK